MRNMGSAPASKVEIIVTNAAGEKVHWLFDSFQEFTVDTFHAPMYYHEPGFEHLDPPPRISQMVFTVERPGTYRVWVPSKAEQPAIDDGNVVEEG